MKGSPGGILLIALGVIFLNLGWTGRWSDVWDALTGNTSDASGSDLTENESSGYMTNDVPPEWIETPGPNGCPGGTTWMVDSMGTIGACVINEYTPSMRQRGWSMAPFPGQPQPQAAGDASLQNDVMVPTGGWQRRWAPNVTPGHGVQ